MSSKESTIIDVDGQPVTLTNPSKVFFPESGLTKYDICNYYQTIAPAWLQWSRSRPCTLKRFPDGVSGPSFVQKHLKGTIPEWVSRCEVQFVSGAKATVFCPETSADLVWLANNGALELHTWPVRSDMPNNPDELRIDLDPQETCSRSQLLAAAEIVMEFFDSELGTDCVPKTSGNRGIHVYVKLERKYDFSDTRFAGLVIATHLSTMHPHLFTAKWKKASRDAPVFLDFNQNARDRATISPYSIRVFNNPVVSLPFSWPELDAFEPTSNSIDQVLQNTSNTKVNPPSQNLDLDRVIELADNKLLRKRSNFSQSAPSIAQ